MTETAHVPFEPGQTVVVGSDHDGAQRWCRTTVRKVDQRVVWIDGAPADQPAFEAQPGEDVVCHTWRTMDALYQVRARVTFARLAPEPLVGLTVLSCERIQQREYVRVPLATEASGLYLGANRDSGPVVEPRPFRLQVRDLSAGGLRGRCSLALSPGDELRIDLPLPHSELESPAPAQLYGRADAPVRVHGRVVRLPDLPEPLNLRARVVRLVETALADDLACEIGVAFVDVSREVRERIIRFALHVQRDRRRRGML